MTDPVVYARGNSIVVNSSCCSDAEHLCLSCANEVERRVTSNRTYLPGGGILLEDPEDDITTNDDTQRKALSMSQVFHRTSPQEAEARIRAQVLERLALNVRHDEPCYLPPIINYADDVRQRDAQNGSTTTEHTDNVESAVYLPPVPNYREWSKDRSEYGRA